MNSEYRTQFYIRRSPTPSVPGPPPIIPPFSPDPPLTTDLFPILGGDDRNYGTVGLYLYPYVRVPYSPAGCPPVTGTITLDVGLTTFGVIPPEGSMVVQWMLNGQPLSPYITGPIVIHTNNFGYAWDTTTVTDGSYVVYLRIVDTTSLIFGMQGYRIRCNTSPIMVHNTGPVTMASQVVPVAPISATAFLLQPLPDFVTWPGTPPAMNSTPYPSQPSPPATTTVERNFLLDAGNWYAEDIPGNRDFEYDGQCRWRTTTAGGVFVQIQESISRLDLEDAVINVIRHAPFDGLRNDTLVDPYSTFLASVDEADEWYAISLFGALYEINHVTGETETIAGWRQDRSKLPIDDHDLSTTDAQVFAQYEFVGTIVSPTFDPIMMHGLNDVCQDPRDHNIFYLANPIHNFIIKVDENFSPPHVSRFAGQAGPTPGYADGDALTTAQFFSPYSIIISDGTGNQGPIGTIYVADFNNWAIRKISPDGTTVTTLVGKQTGKAARTASSRTWQYLDLENPATSDTWSPPGTVAFADAYIGTPQTIRFTSGGDIVFFENASSILRRINMASSTVSRIYATDWDRNGTVWTWLSVDTQGTCGPVDNIMMTKSATSFGVPLKVFSLDGSYFANFAGDGSGYLPEGPLTHAGVVSQPAPGYAWAIEFSKLEARMIMSGFRINGYTMWRKRLPGDPVVDPSPNIGLNTSSYSHGQQMYRRGTCLCFPWNSRPSLSRVHGPWGRAHLGSVVAPSFDELNILYPTDAALGAYIQGGMGGSVPRPEFTGRDLRDLIYFIRRSTAAGSYPVPVAVGATDPDVTLPIISSVGVVRLSTTSIRVTWTTDKPTLGMAVAGTAASLGTDTPYHLWSPFESGYSTSHNCTITGLPVSTLMYYSVVSKDVAGNHVCALNRTIA
jgi:hypothetical protein